MWAPEHVTAELTYSFLTGNILSSTGRVIDHAGSLTEACKRYDGVVFNYINVQLVK